jgi:hypothetical protein
MSNGWMRADEEVIKKKEKGKNVCEKKRRFDRLKMRGGGGMRKTKYWGTKNVLN